MVTRRPPSQARVLAAALPTARPARPALTAAAAAALHREHFFYGRANGTFLEMGAVDGEHLSNSLWFARRAGWRGLLIEALPGAGGSCWGAANFGAPPMAVLLYALAHFNCPPLPRLPQLPQPQSCIPQLSAAA